MDLIFGKGYGALVLALCVCLSAGQAVPASVCSYAADPGSTVQHAYCSCDERLSPSVQQIGEVVVNRTGCKTYSELDASHFLDSDIDFELIEFIGAHINFNSRVHNGRPVSTLKNIIFTLCIFDTIPGRAFEGLNNLETMKFFNNFIRVLDSYSISNLNQLFNLEIADSTIYSLESNAISGNPNLKELAFVRSNIGTMKNNSIHILRTPDLPVARKCENKIDLRLGGEARDARVMGDVMGRDFESTNNLPLPEFGARFLIYRTNISVMAESAVESDIFSFMILAGSRFQTIRRRAFNIELSNECEISAFMLVQNHMERIETEVFAQAKSKLGSQRTYLVMTNNTFQSVEVDSFKFHPSMSIFSLKENRFTCECKYFLWNKVSSNSTQSGEVKNYDQTITDTATCSADNVGVEKFLQTCSSPDSGSCEMTFSNLYFSFMIFFCIFFNFLY